MTTLPGLRVPIHVSYLVYLGSFSPALASAYFALALRLCRWAGVPPSLLLHSLDFLGREDVPELAFFPGMNLTAARKRALVARAVDQLAAGFRVVNLAQHAAEAGRDERLPRQRPRFGAADGAAA